MNPHGWQDFGDFAADAGPGIGIFLLLVLIFALWANRKGGDR